MELNDFGKIPYNEWENLPERFPNMQLDVFKLCLIICMGYNVDGNHWGEF
jgi:hypothetical protein